MQTYNKPSLHYLQFKVENLITASGIQDSVIINNSQVEIEPIPDHGGLDEGLD